MYMIRKGELGKKHGNSGSLKRGTYETGFLTSKGPLEAITLANYESIPFW